MMEDTIRRINELARKAKTVGLTEDEIAERDVLRKQYIASVRGNLCSQLDRTYVVEPDGTKHKLGHK